MKKKLWYYAMAAFMAVAFVACNDDEDESFEVIGDAYYITQNINGQPRTAAAFYVYANQPIASASVSLPGGGTRQLSDAYNLTYTWLWEPDTADYAVDYPSEGSYQFETTSEDGSTFSSTDVLEAEMLTVPVIKTTQYNSSNFTYRVTWDSIPKADAYTIKIIEPGEGVIYSSFTLNEKAKSYTISTAGTGYWSDSPVSGRTYIFQLHAFIFEDEATSSDYVYNVQEISIGSKNVVWGQ